jgi:hypothetical protein
MKIIVTDVLGMTKMFLKAISIFLILFGIHWMVIVTGAILGALSFAIPKRYLN